MTTRTVLRPAEVDPYAVKGQERLKGFVPQFKNEASLGPEGVLNQCCVLRRAKKHLAPDLYERFCVEVGISNEEATKLYEVALDHREFTACLGPESLSTLLLYSFSVMDHYPLCDVLNWDSCGAR